LACLAQGNRLKRIPPPKAALRCDGVIGILRS